MAKKKSTIKEIVINVLLLAATGGILAWRINDCKKKEKEQAEQVAEAQLQAKKNQEKREQTCIEHFDETERNDCTKCTCTKCIDAYDSCYADKSCRTMSLDELLVDGGPSSDDPGRIRFENRAKCMIENCAAECTAKKK